MAKEKFSESKDIKSSEQKELFDKSAVFDVSRKYDIKIIKDKFISDFKKNYPQEYNQMMQLLDNAEKDRDFGINNHRVRKIINICDDRGDDDYNFFVFLGFFYLDFKEDEKAKDCLYWGHQYITLFNLGDRGYEIALGAFIQDPGNEEIIKCLCDYAIERNNIALIKYLFKKAKTKKLKSKIGVYWYDGSSVINNIPDKKDIFSEKNADYFDGKFSQNPADTSSIEKDAKELFPHEEYDIEFDDDKSKTLDSSSSDEKTINSYEEYDIGYNDERNILGSVIPAKLKNSFEDLRQTEKDSHYKGKALRNKKNGNFEEAENDFIKAIANKEPKAVEGLINMYAQPGSDNTIKGLQLLQACGHMLEPDVRINKEVEFLDKLGNLDACEKMLSIAAEKCSKARTKLQYMIKLAVVYCKKNEWQNAIDWFNKSLDNLEKDFSEEEKEKRKINFFTPRIIATYECGRLEEAKELALEYRELLKKSSGNDDIDSFIDSVINGTYKYNGTDIEKSDIDYKPYSGEIESKYLSAKLKDFDYTNISQTELPEKIENGKFIGSAEDAENIIDMINNGTDTEANQNPTTYLFVAKIISDVNEKLGGNSKFELNKYLSAYAHYSADNYIRQKKFDTARFLYIQSIKLLPQENGENFHNSIKNLENSFFLDFKALSDELNGLNTKRRTGNYNDPDKFSNDFMIATFMLADKKAVVDMLQKAYMKTMLPSAINVLNRICELQEFIHDYNEFEALWENAKSRYYDVIRDIRKELSDSVKEYNMAASIQNHIAKLNELQGKNLLWKQDKKILEEYVKLIEFLSAVNGNDSFEKKNNAFYAKKSKIAKLKREIDSSPTELTYDFILGLLEELENTINADFENMYKNSQPEIKISLFQERTYVNEGHAKVVIKFENSKDKQSAENIKVKLNGSVGAEFLKFESIFSYIKGGEDEYAMAVFQLNNEICLNGRFSICVNMSYSYYNSSKQQMESCKNEEFTVVVSDKDCFKKIKNEYNILASGKPVDINTPYLFKGRDKLIADICDSMSSRDGIMTKNMGIVLWGQRKVGKNSVKDFLKEKMRSKYKDAYLILEIGSFGEIPGVNVGEILKHIVETMLYEFEEGYPDLYKSIREFGIDLKKENLNCEMGYRDFSIFIRRFVSALKKVSPPEKNIPLFFFDEFSYIYDWSEEGKIDGNAFMKFWKSFMQDYGICAIIIAQDNLPILVSRYENEFACMDCSNEITYLDFSGSKELICDPCRVDGKSLFTPEAVNLIYGLTKGNAFSIAIFCKYVIQYLNDNCIEVATKAIAQLVFEIEFIEKKKMYTKAHFEPQMKDGIYVGQPLWESYKQNEILLTEIAAKTIEQPSVKIENLRSLSDLDKNYVGKLIRRLNDRKIINIEADKSCSIKMPLLKMFLLREKSLLTKQVFDRIIRRGL